MYIWYSVPEVHTRIVLNVLFSWAYVRVYLILMKWSKSKTKSDNWAVLNHLPHFFSAVLLHCLAVDSGMGS